MPRYTTEKLCACLPNETSHPNGSNKPQNFLVDKLEELVQGSHMLIKRLVSRSDSLDSNDDTSSTNSVQSTGSIQSTDSGENWVTRDEKLCSDADMEIPAEFQVREFPASSLFSTPSQLNQKHHSSIPTLKSTQNRIRLCKNHPTDHAHSRHERYYHVFKQGELECLVSRCTQNLKVLSCSYNSGHWQATITKAPIL